MTDAKAFSDLFSTELEIAGALRDGNSETSFKTFTYMDTIKVETRRMGSFGMRMTGCKEVERTGYLIVTNKDTLIIK